MTAIADSIDPDLSLAASQTHANPPRLLFSKRVISRAILSVIYESRFIRTKRPWKSIRARRKVRAHDLTVAGGFRKNHTGRGIAPENYPLRITARVPRCSWQPVTADGASKFLLLSARRSLSDSSRRSEDRFVSGRSQRALAPLISVAVHWTLACLSGAPRGSSCDCLATGSIA